jgi:hypothetical protein
MVIGIVGKYSRWRGWRGFPGSIAKRSPLGQLRDKSWIAQEKVKPVTEFTDAGEPL